METNYHPCTQILIQALLRVKADGEQVAREIARKAIDDWDKARCLVDSKL